MAMYWLYWICTGKTPLYCDFSSVFEILCYDLQKHRVCPNIHAATDFQTFWRMLFLRFGTVRSEVRILSPRLFLK
jgi:hypothetical protein